MEKLKHLDGLRGIACLVVAFSHFINGFFPAAYTGFHETAHTAFDTIIYKTPLQVFVNGNFAVCIFFILSAYVLSYKFFNNNDNESPVAGIVKRYFRLFIPVFFTLIIVYFLMRLGLFKGQTISHITNSGWLDYYWNFPPRFLDMLYEAFYGVFIEGRVNYHSDLWTMQIEFLGSMLVFAYLSLFGKQKNRLIIYIVLIFIFLKSYYLAFILGIMLCDYWRFIKDSKYLTYLTKFAWVIIPIGLLLGSYPTSAIASNLPPILNIPFINSPTKIIFIHIIGALLVIIGILSSKPIMKFLASKTIAFFGRISFSLYLFNHIVIATFSSFLFAKLINHFSYNISFIITFIPSLLLMIGVSYIYTKYVDEKAIKFANYMYYEVFKKGDLFNPTALKRIFKSKSSLETTNPGI